MQLQERHALLIVLGAWLISMACACMAVPIARVRLSGVAMGSISSLIGLLILGSKLVQPAEGGGTAAGDTVPNAPWIALGFLASGAILGWAAAEISRVMRCGCECGAGTSFGMAKATIRIAAPLMFVGGLVTSTDSGMAVPDWPNTFGTNMFLYPLGPRVQPAIGEEYTAIYLEHAHRLFGALTGLSALALAIWVFACERRRWVKVLTSIVFLLVVAQGLLGAMRVIENARLLALFHGVSAQVIFASFCVICGALSTSFQDQTPVPAIANHRRIRALTGAAVHASIVQLFFGALYRHFRDGPGGSHALWTHVGFSVVVLVLGVIGGSLAAGIAPEHRTHPLVKSLQRAGRAAVILVGLQFLLGWMTLFMGGREVEAPTQWQALLRTAHQANGALMLAAFTFTAVYARRLSWLCARQG
jgi:cytochrome c oxidase assembly protein subunit 15